MGTICAPLAADIFLFCYERDFMLFLSDHKQTDVIDAFNTTSRYLDDIININSKNDPLSYLLVKINFLFKETFGHEMDEDIHQRTTFTL